MCLCVEYLFDLCLGLRLIMSADRWLQVYLVRGAALLPLGIFFCFPSQPVSLVSIAADEALQPPLSYIRVYVSVSVGGSLQTMYRQERFRFLSDSMFRCLLCKSSVSLEALALL